MGFLSRLLGRSEDDDSPVVSAVVSSDEVRTAVDDLATNLEELARAMGSEGSPVDNPGWRGRANDLRGANRDLRMLLAQPQFTKDDLYEAIITVRPLYRGTAPEEYAHLDELNTRVDQALRRVYDIT
ncbi:hypothetical protein [Aestuariimicrobium ganziense]|uniref:hypothetical protein n=1 Tax=Aestuariimicrobium ganziense TaxID=2773677 RepID=UPI001944F9E7|nr:hypothetical protein [Aestuariimicrobium ganziense]